MEYATIQTKEGPKQAHIHHRNGPIIVTEYQQFLTVTHEATGCKLGTAGFNTPEAAKGFCDEVAPFPEWPRVTDQKLTGLSKEEKKALGLKVGDSFKKWQLNDEEPY